MTFLKARLVLPIAVLLLVIPAFGQLTSGNITGTVFDPTGASVPDVEVVATHDSTGVQNTTKTTSKGDYRFENLPVGSYTLTVTAQDLTRAKLRT
jgi:uncharacterized protein (DUF2249 family)